MWLVLTLFYSEGVGDVLTTSSSSSLIIKVIVIVIIILSYTTIKKHLRKVNTIATKYFIAPCNL